MIGVPEIPRPDGAPRRSSAYADTWAARNVGAPRRARAVMQRPWGQPVLAAGRWNVLLLRGSKGIATRQSAGSAEITASSSFRATRMPGTLKGIYRCRTHLSTAPSTVTFGLRPGAVDTPVGRLAIALMLLVGMARPFHADDVAIGDLEIRHPWSREVPTGARVAAGYLVIANKGRQPTACFP